MSTIQSEGQAKALQIRIITPELARSCSDSRSILPLPTTVSPSCTLKELKSMVQQHLGFGSDNWPSPELECNCNFAQTIVADARLNLRHHDGHDALNNVILVHDANIVTVLPVNGKKLSSMRQAVNNHLEHVIQSKTITTFGGTKDPSSLSDSDQSYEVAPVFAVCSNRRHKKHPGGDITCSSLSQHPRDLLIDIHTSECPIEVTAHNANVSIAAIGLEDCAIDGVLNIFAVQRWSLSHTESVAQGKAGIIKKTKAWGHHMGQTDRGISALLSTLRVFADLTAGDNMDDARQDAILHLLYLLTRFPPAVRAAYILMRGETPDTSERAALSLCIYEILKTVIPLKTVRSNAKRLYEGSRLLFGLIFEKAKNLKVWLP